MPLSKRDDLIDAAMKVFYRSGFHASGLDRVLEEGGISRMTLYNHFKSKDDLIAAALRRRDEIFMAKLKRFIEKASDDPIEQLHAVFDFHEQWFTGRGFHGCMFINASAEFCDPKSQARRIAAETKKGEVDFLESLSAQAGLSEPREVAEQLQLLLEGAIVTAHVVGSAGSSKEELARPAQVAKQIALAIIDAHRGR